MLLTDEEVEDFQFLYLDGGIDGQPTSTTESGTRYVVLTSGGVKLEGENYSIFCTSPDEAVLRWTSEFSNYRQAFGGEGRQVVWRMRPRLQQIEFCSHEYGERGLQVIGLYTIYSRLCLEQISEAVAV